MKRRKIKIRFVLLAVLLIALFSPFVLWKLTNKGDLDIVVLNKTFPIETSASGKVKQMDYSKQSGLYWLINYLGIKNPETNKAYDVHHDYYGNFLSEGKLVNKPLKKLKTVPDVIFLSDMYGTGNSRANGKEPSSVSGMTKEEVGVVSTAYERGTTVFGEYNIAGEPTKASISKELEGIFGLHFTGLAGKFFSDLSSTSDVPNWIRATYENQYGKKWAMAGAGIVIAGNDRIIVLQRNLGFSGQSLRISMSGQREDFYHAKPVDYYNWFEIVQPTDDQSVIAWYDLNLTTAGENQLKPFGLGSRFPAIIAQDKDGKHAYYMAGDFTDYRGPDKINQFLGASTIYRYFSVNSEGDLSYFYWHFYVPFLSKVLKDIEPLGAKTFQAETETVRDSTELASKITDKQFSVYRNGKWNKMYVKGVDIGPTIPGQSEGKLPDDPDFYKEWFGQIAGMNANTIRVYALMPPAFYRALDGYNFSHRDNRLYLLQNISMRQDPPAGNYLDKAYDSSYRQAVENTINAIHGNATVSVPDGKEPDVYMNDVSSSVLGYLVDPGLTLAAAAATDAGNGVSLFNGEYVSTGDGATPTEAWLATLLDHAYGFEQQNYGMQHPAGIVSNPQLNRLYREAYGPPGSEYGVQVETQHFNVSDKVISGLFGAYDIFLDEPGFTDSASTQTPSSFAGFKEYMGAFVKEQGKFPVLVSGFGLSTSGGTTEAGQGQGIVSLLSIIKNSGAMGGLIYEWADEWGRSNDNTAPFMVPYSRGDLWHNIADPMQNYGILAMESKIPTEYAMTLRGSAPLNTLALTADESYLYLRADFTKLPDFKRNDIMIYLDTVDRKNGEYMLAPDVNENWSGAEFNIQIQSPSKGDLLVIPSYNASKGSYYTSISAKGIFERMTRQLSSVYTTLSGKKVRARYEDASALTPGSFANGTNNFYLEGNTLHVRIPWAKLNFTDPSSLLVLNDDKHQGVMNNQRDSLTVRMTDGIVPSLVIMDKATKQVDYHFPESVTSPGYKTFSWNSWDVPKYEQRAKSSYDYIKAAFAE